ncbi:MAG: arsenical pump-driving ATPase [Tetrasphaera sp.]
MPTTPCPGFLEDLPRFAFFTGKGGVGKTSLACAAATRLADAGERVLLVSTDPASNVAQVFGQEIGNRITPIIAVPGLDAMEIDPQGAAAAYRERIVGPVRGLLPEAEIAAITEQLSGSCTTEVASFNEFTDLLADDALIAPYDHVLFDTAPTGHTIRLLQLPGEWTTFLDAGKGDASCLGPMAGLDKAHSTYAAALARLRDPRQTRLVLVARAQPSALGEAARTADELGAVGITGQHLVINAVLPQPDHAGSDELAGAVNDREQRALTHLPARLTGLPLTTIPLRPAAVLGVDLLRELFAAEPSLAAPAASGPAPADALPGLDALVDELAGADHGLVLCMGKGGVGKTTVAAALAIALAERGKTVHLSTTDPAAHIEDVLGGTIADHLTVSRIDPHAAIAAYRERVLTTKGAHLDADGRARLAEDLMSPCTEEVAVFGEFSHLVSQARRQFVVIDTAPTGHTLLLMDATGSYHRDIVRNLDEQQSAHVTTPLMRLQDPNLTHVVIVTLPEATPVQEALDLQEDLQRAGINPWAWVVNQSLAATGTTDPLLAARAAAEAHYLARVDALAPRVAAVPLLAREPVGSRGLHALIHQPA